MRDFKLERFSRQMFIKSNQNCSQRTLKWKSDGRWGKYKFKKSYSQSWEDKPFAVWGFRAKALTVVVIEIFFFFYENLNIPDCTRRPPKQRSRPTSKVYQLATPTSEPPTRKAISGNPLTCQQFCDDDDNNDVMEVIAVVAMMFVAT